MAEWSWQRLIAQMVVVRACGHLYDRQRQYPQWELTKDQLKRLISDYGIGGVILLGGTAPEVYLRIQELQSWAEYPLLIAADVEEGVGQRFAGATRFPPPMALAGLEPRRCFEFGRVTAEEAASLGINWLLAPVADVNSNPLNPVINVRAFGSEPYPVSERVREFIYGAKQQPVLTTAKHFPGHGDTKVDSHLTTPVLGKNLEQLRQLEFIPFQGAIDVGVDAIMTAHLLLPEIDNQVATMSELLLTKILRQEWGFSGLIVTDALVMAGIRERYSLQEMVLGAIKAGNDILLMPPDPIATIEIIYQAVKRGEIDRDRIYQSVNRICQAKAKLRPPQKIPDFDQLHYGYVADRVAQDSIQWIHGGKINLPQRWLNLVVTDCLPKASELLTPQSPAYALPISWGATTIYAEFDQLTYYSLPRERSIFVQIYTRGNPFQGNIANLQSLIELLRDKQILGGILYGNPYLIPIVQANFPQPWLFSYGHYQECQKLCLNLLLPPDSSKSEREFV
ncbi:MAG: glycoside hydrolase family 3 N-terminal domain-containing protein [Pseudanabaenaceae cyanobacterium SKYGB_i_bin29]|nr:beta-N-acetylhexosaminidase [Pseudanabaenaceae cyanobacterium SKYG29]MDW8421882.1 glycoside hydrolase family 3 N-terminal domain-containing protein [Pseudanabaenaceae cyanobacterium SKYGB_i_bin29]